MSNEIEEERKDRARGMMALTIIDLRYKWLASRRWVVTLSVALTCSGAINLLYAWEYYRQFL